MFSPKRCVFYTVIIPLNIVRALYLFVIINLIGLQSRGLKDALSMFFMNKNEFLQRSYEFYKDPAESKEDFNFL